MTTIPLPLLLGLALLAFTAVVLLWKVLIGAAGLGVAQWLLVQAADDNAAVQISVFAVLALPTVFVLSRVLGTHHRPARARESRFVYGRKENVV
ncbi:hypothetical protein FKR81_16675 [Lentzea tibetensis]|uniref:Uncharacterized protein n=1 Tax=Lentzea tibetensis TaxID=2591470 RepID=A0A563EU47_9PSEU|nr:hypothetical protein [Lentzea tibetensis]TWP51247.1 hypothetical protein FKR81_16675 [Lentzea tibetensis]